ncbi:MAG: GNAT family N-acetyltransferase [Burkholderiaceae bacterium]|jgi:RimJ/RimL family protein N-acetyltransferase|nr:GNAT family N-acetyltransferase [Burkholderiaceae bacterium]
MAQAAPLLETPRLRLRPFGADDWPAYAAMCADAEVMRHVGTGQVQSADDAWRSMAVFLGHWALRGYGMWALEHRDSGALLGRVGYIDPPGWPGFELGWLLARPHWGHGYAREAAAVALRHAFDVLQRDRVISLIRPGNARSVAVAEAIGESLQGSVELMGGEALVYEARR